MNSYVRESNMRRRGATFSGRSGFVGTACLGFLMLLSVGSISTEWMVGQAAAPLPAYDVATFRVNTTGSGNVDVNSNRDSLRAHNWPLSGMLQDAFHVQKDLLFGLPDWARQAHYDVNAKISAPDPAQLKALPSGSWRLMLLALLEDRFAIKWHYETRTVAVDELVVAKSGSKLVPTTARPGNSGTSTHNYDLTATAVTLQNLSDILAQQVERPVVDKTGLTGSYDFHLHWTPERALSGRDRGSDDETAPSLFTALQEQLGLRLQAGKDPVQVVVIDAISPPTDN